MLQQQKQIALCNNGMSCPLCPISANDSIDQPSLALLNYLPPCKFYSASLLIVFGCVDCIGDGPAREVVVARSQGKQGASCFQPQQLTYNHFPNQFMMKDKYSVFSPPYSKPESFQTQINFKKSPNKFLLYQPAKSKEPPRNYPAHSLTSTNLDNLRKLPNEYSNLRQTLSFKPTNFNALIDQDEKVPKTSSYLRQTMSTKPLKQKVEKSFSQSYSSYIGQSSLDSSQKQEKPNLSYSRKTSYVPESKSWNTLQPPKAQNSIQQLRKKWKEGGFKPSSQSKSDKLMQQLQQLRKIAQNQKVGGQDSERRDRRPSKNEAKEQDNNLFRKKSNAQDQYDECYTPKLPKHSYEERFKKVGSPTSTDNSDSRSPPNKYIEADPKKKAAKLSAQEFAMGKTLGEGKFGVVSLARHKKTGSLFALKKIPKEMIKSHMMVDQLALEIRLQSCLNHKNILGIYGFFEDSTHLFIVLEYMEHGTLYAQLKKNKILQESEAAVIIKQVSLAVQYLHDQDIAHRDIKPQNIVISNKVYKLCDFGWATLCNERRKTYCGTFDYAAPQILEGKQYDMSVDLWCLGVLTYELLTGKAPFYHLSRKQTMRKIINCESEAVVYSEKMSPEAVDFIERLIRKNPDERMKAAQALKHPFLANVDE